MEMMPAKSWKHEFARSTEAERYREITRRHHDELRRKKDKDDKAREDGVDDLADLAFVVMASESDIDVYLITTAHYQTATYEAIIENQQFLDDVRRERQEMLERAFVLSDGRRVFESEDGRRVFDEHGLELDPADVSADEIEDWRPKYEPYAALGEKEEFLVEEQAELQAYQAKIDEARERLEQGEITEREFDAMKKDLAESMPDRVFDNLPDEHKPERDAMKTDELVVESIPILRPAPML